MLFSGKSNLVFRHYCVVHLVLQADMSDHCLLVLQTSSKLYLVLDFINGGHLFFQLYRQVSLKGQIIREHY